MLRVLITIIVGALIGVGLGRLQSTVANSGFEERFAGSRATLAETRGEKTKSEVIQQSTGTPKVEVLGGTEYRFGTMQHGESMSHDFVFRNIGDGPLNLDMGESTCKCTVGELESSVLQPGEETKVTLTWRAEFISNEFGQTATIHTNAPDMPEVRLQVMGQIADSFVIEPNVLSLGDISVTDTVSRTFHVFTYLEKSKALTDFFWEDDNTRKRVKIDARKVDLDPVRFPNHKNAFGVHEVSVIISPGLNIGPLNTQISFMTDLAEDVGNLELPVKGKVTGDITFIGGPSFDPNLNILQIGTVKSSEGARVSLTLVAQGNLRDTVRPEVASVKPADALVVKIGEAKTAGARKLFPLTFEVPKGAPESYYSGGSPKDFGKVIIKTNHEFIPEVAVHLRMNVVK